MGVLVLVSNALIFLLGGNHQDSIAIAISWFCALYGIAVWTSTPEFLAGLAVLVFTNVLATLGPGRKLGDAVLFTVVPGVAMLILRSAVRDRQLRAETLATRADLLEREQQQAANEAVVEERARIARELHDIVAHNVSVMVVQAGAERHALPEDQASTREALSSIEQSGRQALTEARRLLGMLRRSGEHEGLEPQPSISQVGVLVEQMERAGLAVEHRGSGGARAAPSRRRPLRLPNRPGGADQLPEACGGPPRPRWCSGTRSRGLDIAVLDDGGVASEPSNDGAGHGLIGMRERVALYGGDLKTGPRTCGGFEIRAHLPLA